MLRLLALWLVAGQADLMSEAHRTLVKPVLEAYTLQREYPARTFRGRVEQFEFFMDNMVACSMLSEALGLISYRAVDDGSGRLVADDGSGARGFLLQVGCVEGRRTYYVEGTQQGLFQARGRGVVTVTFKQTGPETIEYSGRMKVKIDNEVLAALARAFFIFVKGTVDRHFDHVLYQPIYLSSLALDDPHTVRQWIDRMPAADYQMLAPLRQSLR